MYDEKIVISLIMPQPPKIQILIIALFLECFVSFLVTD